MPTFVRMEANRDGVFSTSFIYEGESGACIHSSK